MPDRSALPDDAAADPAGRRLVRVYRPVKGRLVPRAVAAVFVLLGVALAAALPSAEGPGGFGVVDRVAIVAFLCVLAGGVLVLGRPRVELWDDGLLVVNLLRSRRLDWAEIVEIYLSRNDSWAMADLSDGSTLALMGLQSTDGPVAAAGVAAIRAELARRAPSQGPT